ncbi:hypothetical protein LOC54_06435 [Acetobacter sp. AN02]|uniref:YtcA family lipoprotein n=1 Tax=Acetobacter sp. AN02 TaxID=2894186 RepID=UPI0024346788|nr:YtcA family lipoprotein [Acetobacter sp. AN02]MDG6094747.1 hypothetical protein [Acetobacter sp. AN02]
MENVKRMLTPLVAGMLLSGCGTDPAPSYPIIGAYFPSWMLCAIVGILAAIIFRVIFVITGLDGLLSFRFFTYVALGTIAGLLLWSAAFGP